MAYKRLTKGHGRLPGNPHFSNIGTLPQSSYSAQELLSVALCSRRSYAADLEAQPIFDIPL
jgi:hypothetical protein